MERTNKRQGNRTSITRIGPQQNTNTKTVPARKPVLIQEAKTKPGAQLNTDSKDAQTSKPTRNSAKKNVSSFAGSSSRGKVVISSEDFGKRYIDHDLPIQNDPSAKYPPAPPSPRQHSTRANISDNSPEVVTHGAFISETKHRSKPGTRVNNNGVVKTQGKFDPCLKNMKNDGPIHNANVSDIKTIRKSQNGQNGANIDQHNVVNESECSTINKANAQKDKQFDRVSSSSPEAKCTDEMNIRFARDSCSASISPSSTHSSLSRKSIFSLNSNTSQSSLADRILENRSVMKLDTIQASLSADDISNPQTSCSDVAPRRNSSFSDVSDRSRGGAARRSSLLSSAFDLKTQKKHLPDIVPNEGENSSPLIRRRAKRQILQA